MTELRTWGGVQAALNRGDKVNPYWVEWVRQTGGGAAWEFMIWIQRQWGIFEPEHSMRNLRHVEFREWLVSG